MYRPILFSLPLFCMEIINFLPVLVREDITGVTNKVAKWI